MQNHHLIAKQVFELRVGFGEKNIPQLQNSFSRQYWESVVPAFERLFDRIVPPDKLVRVDRLELDAGRWSAEDILSGRFVEGLVLRLESVITSTLQGSGEPVAVQPVRLGRFDLWLYFLEHGFLPAGAAQPESQEEWLRQVIECLTAESRAVPRFLKLASGHLMVLERLILQHDKVFLGQLLALLTKRSQSDLLKLVDEVVGMTVRVITDLSGQLCMMEGERSGGLAGIVNTLLGFLTDLLELSSDASRIAELREHIGHVLVREASNPAALANWLLVAASWQQLLKGFVQPDISRELSNQIVDALRGSTSLRQLVAEPSSAPIPPTRDQVRQIELTVWRILCDEVISKQRQVDAPALIAWVIRSDALLPWRGMLMKRISAKTDADADGEIWKRVAEAITALPPSVRESAVRQGKPIKPDVERAVLPANAAEKQRISDAEEGDVFYLQAAGVILLHPFLQRFFQNRGLCEKGAFTDEPSRQRAVCLIHHLATDEVRTPEYQLVLPKFLCGMPLNAPLDHFIEIGAEEREESENLIQAAVDHWSALGNCSAGWLREVFLLRDGKLEKRESGWHLLVERKAQDVLLSRLPPGWGLGMVKLPWMDEFLRIDW